MRGAVSQKRRRKPTVDLNDNVNDGNRTPQDRYDGRAVADKTVELVETPTFNDEFKAFVESLPFFFLATSAGCKPLGEFNMSTTPVYSSSRICAILANPGLKRSKYRSFTSACVMVVMP